MSGFIALHRGFYDHDIFEGDEFSRRDAWVWLIAHAAWKPVRSRVKGTRIELQRGELCFSQRFLAEKWGWSKSKVDRFIALLRAEGMIETRSKIGATAGHPAGQGQSIITICNYDKYQAANKEERGNDNEECGATAGQQRGKEEQGNKGNKEELVGGKPPSYAFFGRVIRLNDRDLADWKRTFHGIPDLVAELSVLDGWWQTQPEEKRKGWFHATKAMLNKKHQTNMAERKIAANGGGWDGMP